MVKKMKIKKAPLVLAELSDDSDSGSDHSYDVQVRTKRIEIAAEDRLKKRRLQVA